MRLGPLERIRLERVDADAANAIGEVRFLNRVVGEPDAVAVAAASPEVRCDLIGVRRQAQRIVVLDVAHVPVVEHAVAAAHDVVALAIDIPRSADARQGKRSAIVEDAGRGAARLDVAQAVQLLVGPGVEERARVRVVEVGREVAAEAIQFTVVRPVAEADAVFHREVRPQSPAVLGERIEVPVAPFAGGLARGRVAVARRSLVELADAADEHVRARVPGAGVVVVAEPQLTGFEVLEILLLLTALRGKAELQAVRAGELRQLVADLQRVVVREHVVRLCPEVADLAAAAPAVQHVCRKIRARRPTAGTCR